MPSDTPLHAKQLCMSSTGKAGLLTEQLSSSVPRMESPVAHYPYFDVQPCLPREPCKAVIASWFMGCQECRLHIRTRTSTCERSKLGGFRCHSSYSVSIWA